jgi:hypothetical protein
MEMTAEGNFVELLKKAMIDLPEGKIEFRGPQEGFVTVTFIEGEILLVESTWGTGNDELQRIYDWQTGTSIIRDLSPEERKILETKWQRPVILDAAKKETKTAISLDHSVKVQALLRDLKRKTLDLDTFLEEIREKKHSGEARVTTPRGRKQVLFYRGSPLYATDRRAPSLQEARVIMDEPDAMLNFYLLGDELAHAFLSVFEGEKVWQGLSVSVFHVDKMLGKLMENNPTGHLCVHKGKGGRHYCFFFQGEPLGVFDLESHWRPVDISTLWEDAQSVDYYRSGKIESYASTAGQTSSSQDFGKFLPLWNDLIEGIAKKVGKKPVEKAVRKNFGELPFYRVEGSTLQLAREGSQVVAADLKLFNQAALAALKAIESLVGAPWLNEQLQEFRERNGDVIGKLSLTEVFSKKGD